MTEEPTMGVVSGEPPVKRDNRVLFDLVAEQYDRARPTYPAALFDDIVALSGVPDGGRVLEIGCGTGQATRPMAERGYRITAIELGRTSRPLRGGIWRRWGVDVQVGAFEEWTAPTEPFDLVMCVSAFHWLDHAVALPKIARDPAAGRGAGVHDGRARRGRDVAVLHRRAGVLHEAHAGDAAGAAALAVLRRSRSSRH